jgi:hypothetical protein
MITVNDNLAVLNKGTIGSSPIHRDPNTLLIRSHNIHMSGKAGVATLTLVLNDESVGGSQAVKVRAGSPFPSTIASNRPKRYSITLKSD